MIARNTAYGRATLALRDRILALIPDHPEILEIENPFKLFKIEGFTVADLGPTLAQARYALASAKALYRKGRR